MSIEEALAAETRESGSVTWAMLLKPSPALKRMLLVGIGVAISQQVPMEEEWGGAAASKLRHELRFKSTG